MRLAGDSGLQAWKWLVREYEPKAAMRFSAMLTNLLKPRWDATKDFVPQWLESERRVAHYELSAKTRLPGDIKCATILRWGPQRVRQ